MPLKDTVIETGADRLISLIEKKKEISITEAAKILTMPKVVVEEWASFLEEEGVITIEYKFSNAILKLRKVSEKDMQRKTKEFVGKKEGFVRELESTLGYIDKEMGGLGKMRKEFDELAKEVQQQVQHIEDEFKTLEKFEKLKNDLDKEIVTQEQGLKDDVQRINRELDGKKKEYEQLIKTLETDEVHLDEEKVQAASLIKEEDLLTKELDRVTAWIDSIRKKIGDEKGRIHDAEGHMDGLKQYGEKIKLDIQKKEDSLSELINRSKSQEAKIIELQKGILQKFTTERKKMDDDTKFLGALKERLQNAFQKKKKIMELTGTMEQDLSVFRKEFETLIKKAKIIQLTTNDVDVEKHIKELQEKYSSLEQRRRTFEKEVIKLTSWIKQD